MKIEDVWNLLEQDGSNTTSGYLTRRILPEVNYDIYLAIEKPLDTRLLILRVKSVLLDRKTIYPSSRSFVVNRIALQLPDKKYSPVPTPLLKNSPRPTSPSLNIHGIDSLISLALVPRRTSLDSHYV
jgi:hypothetical protein